MVNQRTHLDKDFFIGLDSDGCVFDTMGLKHMQGFFPALLEVFGLEQHHGTMKEAWEYVNLYSKDRGVVRFLGLSRVFQELASHPGVKHVAIPCLAALKKWMDNEPIISVPSFKKYALGKNDPILEKILAWSNRADELIKQKSGGIKPFRNARESIEKMNEIAEVQVVSLTPGAALSKEWENNGMQHLVRYIAGQEQGAKKDYLNRVAKGQYEDDKILMMGDAPGDYEAAKANKILFYPVITGKEERSWDRFYHEAFEKFVQGKFRGDYQEQLISEFNKQWLERPLSK